MKQEKKNEARSKEQGAKRISNVQYPMSKSGKEHLNLMFKDKGIPDSITLSKSGQKMIARDINIFLIQNLGKGPPGRTRSPAMAYCLRPDNKPATSNGSKIYYYNQLLQFNTNRNSIYYKLLNF